MLHDLTHRLAPGLSVFPGDPEVVVGPHPTKPPWRVSALSLGSHSGTHVDAPRHVLADGRGIGSFALDRFVRPGILLDGGARGDNEPIEVDVLEPHRAAIRPGSVVVLRTGWDRHWGDPRYERHPFVGADLAAALVALRIGLVGIDALSVDSTPDGASATHERLLGADVLIVENLRGLSALVAGRSYVFSFAPLAVGDLDGAPVRALAWDLDHAFVEPDAG